MYNNTFKRIVIIKYFIFLKKASSLSARGLLHRTSENFAREVRLESLNISNLTLLHSKTEVGKSIVLPHMFHRALAYERLGYYK